MLRIHFTLADVANTSVAGEPDADLELRYGLRVLFDGAPSPFTDWRRGLRGLLPRALADHTVHTDPTGPARHVDPISSVSPAGPTGTGRPVRVSAAERFREIAVAPHWEQIRARVAADRAGRTRALSDGGTGLLLRTLHPAVRWAAPVLELPGPDRDVRLDGSGLLLQPSVFCWRRPELHGDRILVYPAAAEPVREPRDLGALIGRARAAMLSVLAAGGASTTELALRTGLSAATASQHATILRAAGAISTRRAGQSVLHSLTPLGQRMLETR
ncbi:transcriptional regulator [Longispora fulva]|uniref:DNA-binding transcriptional ArsR family regulator n=1 Tax=Longispora fulva TaxID=619741 RepID=A0A8J7GI62_9ACTN|nr:winged helix-turn-helix domain-containing protein [Longispora fulva]MBG6137950.1 DNA-binding transcriptional ArsR family regulator [Longispora fulva]GIG60203.1 transcriptional regulator [Longispora fulva]